LFDDLFLLHFVDFSLKESLIIVTELIEKWDLFMRLFKKSRNNFRTSLNH
jgi:hypothetical protein